MTGDLLDYPTRVFIYDSPSPPRPSQINSDIQELVNTSQFKLARENDYQNLFDGFVTARARCILLQQKYEVYKISLVRFCLVRHFAHMVLPSHVFKINPINFTITEKELELYIENPKFLWRFSSANYEYFENQFLNSIKSRKVDFNEDNCDNSMLIPYTEDNSPLVGFINLTNQKHIEYYLKKFKFKGDNDFAFNELKHSNDFHLHIVSSAITTYQDFFSMLIIGKIGETMVPELKFQIMEQDYQINKKRQREATEVSTTKHSKFGMIKKWLNSSDSPENSIKTADEIRKSIKILPYNPELVPIPGIIDYSKHSEKAPFGNGDSEKKQKSTAAAAADHHQRKAATNVNADQSQIMQHIKHIKKQKKSLKKNCEKNLSIANKYYKKSKKELESDKAKAKEKLKANYKRTLAKMEQDYTHARHDLKVKHKSITTKINQHYKDNTMKLKKKQNKYKELWKEEKANAKKSKKKVEVSKAGNLQTKSPVNHNNTNKIRKTTNVKSKCYTESLDPQVVSQNDVLKEANKLSMATSKTTLVDSGSYLLPKIEQQLNKSSPEKSSILYPSYPINPSEIVEPNDIPYQLDPLGFLANEKKNGSIGNFETDYAAGLVDMYGKTITSHSDISSDIDSQLTQFDQFRKDYEESLVNAEFDHESLYERL